MTKTSGVLVLRDTMAGLAERISASLAPMRDNPRFVRRACEARVLTDTMAMLGLAWRDIPKGLTFDQARDYFGSKNRARYDLIREQLDEIVRRKTCAMVVGDAGPVAVRDFVRAFIARTPPPDELLRQRLRGPRLSDQDDAWLRGVAIHAKKAGCPSARQLHQALQAEGVSVAQNTVGTRWG